MPDPVQPRRYTQQEATLIELGKLALKVGNNPKTRPGFIKAVKEVAPNARFADQDIDDLRREMTEQRDADRLAAEQERTRVRLENQRSSLAAKYSPEQITEIETVMTKYGLSDYEAGAKLYSADFKPSAASSARDKVRHGTVWEFPELPGLFENPDKAARDMAVQVIDEFRAARG